MNIIDIIVGLLLVWAVWCGWRKGIILQVCSIAGLVIAIWLGFKFGETVGLMAQIDPKMAAVGGFLIVFVVALILSSIISRMVRKLFRFAGLGLLDRMLGTMLSVAKYTIMIGILLSAFNRLNANYKMVDDKVIRSSVTFRPMMRLSEQVIPVMDWLKEQIPAEILPEQAFDLKPGKTAEKTGVRTGEKAEEQPAETADTEAENPEESPEAK